MSRDVLEFFRTNDRENEIDDQSECDDSDDDVFHGNGELDFFADFDEGDHQREKPMAARM